MEISPPWSPLSTDPAAAAAAAAAASWRRRKSPASVVGDARPRISAQAKILTGSWIYSQSREYAVGTAPGRVRPFLHHKEDLLHLRRYGLSAPRRSRFQPIAPVFRWPMYHIRPAQQMSRLENSKIWITTEPSLQRRFRLKSCRAYTEKSRALQSSDRMLSEPPNLETPLFSLCFPVQIELALE